jgi:hypothetical protein
MFRVRSLRRLTARSFRTVPLLGALLSGVAWGAPPETEVDAPVPALQRGAAGFGLRLEPGIGAMVVARDAATSVGVVQQVRLSKDVGGPFAASMTFRLARGDTAGEGSLALGASARWQPAPPTLWLEAGLGLRGGFLGIAEDPKRGVVDFAPELSLAVERWLASWFSLRLASTWCPVLTVPVPHHRVDVVLLAGLSL